MRITQTTHPNIFRAVVILLDSEGRFIENHYKISKSYAATAEKFLENLFVENIFENIFAFLFGDDDSDCQEEDADEMTEDPATVTLRVLNNLLHNRRS